MHPDQFLPSDHSTITFSLSVSVATSSKSTTYFTFNYSKGDYLSECLLYSDFMPCYLSNDAEYIWNTIEHLLMDAMQVFIPTIKIHSHQHPTWFNSDIRYSIKHHRMFHCQYKRHPTQHTSDMINFLKKALQGKITAAKLTFESELINTYTSTNNNKIFNI